MNQENVEVKKVSMLGIFCNLFLLVIKIAVGYIFKSQAMLADGIHSLGDIFVSFMSFIGNKISSKPEDYEHPNGYGKAEYIFSQIIGFTIMCVSIVMFKNSIFSIIYKNVLIYSNLLLFVAIITILLKLLLYLYSRQKYFNTNNILIKSNMEDNKSDIIITFGTLIGILFCAFNMYFVDGIVSCIISIWFFIVGLNIFRESYDVLMDTNLDRNILNQIFKDVLKYKEIQKVDIIYTKPIGKKYLLILKLVFVKNYNTSDLYKIIQDMKNTIIYKYEFIYDIIVDIDMMN